MKKLKKCALGLVAATAAIVAMTGCDRVTESESGVIMTFTDSTGARTSYTADDLLGSYQASGSSLSSQFDKIFEVLVRHYYETYEDNHPGDNGAKMRSLKATATSDVLDVKTTATNNSNNNGTTYEEELESLFDSEGVDNIDELFEKKLYDAEKDDFSEQMNQNFGTGDSSVNGYEAMRDGYYTLNGQKITSFPESEEWGRGNEGWLKGQMPYHIRHILVKLGSASDKSYTQDKISDSTNVGETGEATKVANVILHLAGAQFNTTSGKLEAVSDANRLSFGQIALEFSDDGSSTSYGEYGIMKKNTVGSDSALVHEFQLGTYAFETLYSAREKASSDAYRLTPGLKQSATSATQEDIDENQTVTVSGSGEQTIYDFFSNKGVGQIPLGAALALRDTAKTVSDDTNTPVWDDGKETFYPRNVIYNKYFNKHNVCVITPNAIPANATLAADVASSVQVPSSDADYRYTWLDESSQTASKTALEALNDLYKTGADGAGYVDNSGSVTEESLSTGVYSSQFGNLPGFSIDTTNVVTGINEKITTDANAHNVLTDSEGNVVLAVRAGSGSSYQGIHFITVARSALSEYGLKAVETSSGATQYVNYTESEVKSNGAYTVDSASLSDYYTVYTPASGTTSSKYPTCNGNNLSTYVNYNVNSTSEYSSRRSTVESAITSYLSDLNTYEFQSLFENGAITFADSNGTLESDVKRYSRTKRQSTEDDLWETWTDGWKEYAEMIQAQDDARSFGAGTVEGTLLTELCAVSYGDANDTNSYYASLYNIGGACYYANK